MTFHRYLGPARAGQADFVRVEPQGDAYKVASTSTSSRSRWSRSA